MFLDGSSSKEWLRYKFKNKQAKNISLVPWCLKKKTTPCQRRIFDIFPTPFPWSTPASFGHPIPTIKAKIQQCTK